MHFDCAQNVVRLHQRTGGLNQDHGVVVFVQGVDRVENHVHRACRIGGQLGGPEEGHFRPGPGRLGDARAVGRADYAASPAQSLTGLCGHAGRPADQRNPADALEILIGNPFGAAASGYQEQNSHAVRKAADTIRRYGMADSSVPPLKFVMSS